jgi:hypothetical protein
MPFVGLILPFLSNPVAVSEASDRMAVTDPRRELGKSCIVEVELPVVCDDTLEAPV